MEQETRFSLTILLGCSILFSACSTTSKTINEPSDFARTLRKASRKHQPMLIYSGIDTFYVAHLMLENKRRDITVQLDKADSTQRTTLQNGEVVKDKRLLLYMKDSTSYLLKEPYTIAIGKIDRIEVID